MSSDGAAKEVVLIGCGAMAIETAMYIADIAKSRAAPFVVTDVVSTEFQRIAELESVLGYSVTQRSDVADVEGFAEKFCVIAIGNNEAVLAIRQKIIHAGGRFTNVIHPTAYVSSHATLGEGLILAPFCYVGPFSTVADNSILNVRATIGHDVTLDIGCIISPHANINGDAKIGKSVFLGAGVVVDPTVIIGNFCKVASGVAIKKDVGPGLLVFEKDPQKVKMFHTETGKSLFAR